MRIFRFLCRKEIAELESKLDFANDLIGKLRYIISEKAHEAKRLGEDNQALLFRCNLFEQELRAKPAKMEDNCYMNAVRMLQELRVENVKLKETNYTLEQQLKKKAKSK